MSPVSPSWRRTARRTTFGSANKNLGCWGVYDWWEENHTSQSHGDGQKSLTKEPQASQTGYTPTLWPPADTWATRPTCVVFNWIGHGLWARVHKQIRMRMRGVSPLQELTKLNGSSWVALVAAESKPPAPMSGHPAPIQSGGDTQAPTPVTEQPPCTEGRAELCLLDAHLHAGMVQSRVLW